MKNPSNKIENDIVNWLKSKLYELDYSYAVSRIHIKLNQKISDDDLEEFEKLFGDDLVLKEVYCNQFGNEYGYKYYYCPYELVKFESYLRNWVINHDFPYSFVIVCDDISLSCYERLSDNQIKEFEEEFEVNLLKYEILCGFKKVKYKFV